MTETLLDNVDTAFDPTKDYYAELVGEGKKFKDNQALARAKVEADLTVKQRETVLDEMRKEMLRIQEESKAGASLRELLDELKTQQPLANSNEPKANEVLNQPAIKPEDLKSLVSSEYQSLRAAEREEQNYNSVKAKLETAYGESWKSVLNKQMNDLEMTAEEVDSLARRNPKAFNKTFGLDAPAQRENFNAPPRSNQRNDNFSPKGAEKRTYSYYQKLGTKAFLDPKINNQMLNDIKAIGEEAFYDV